MTKFALVNKPKVENELQTARSAKDIAVIDKALENLNNGWSAASQEMYAATQGQSRR